MPSFPPWVGNSNPTDQQKNEYIRQLKAALIDTPGLKIESGSYTGDGSNPRTISLINQDLLPVFVLVGDTTGTKTIAMTFEGFCPTSLIWIDGAAPTSNSTSITSLDNGSFTVNNGTYTNATSSTYYYVVYGS